MKLNKMVFISIIVVICLIGCDKARNFYQDSYNPGLSRFTSRGYDILSAYINDTAYVNPYEHRLFGGSNSDVSIFVNHTNSSLDTLNISWLLDYSDTSLGFYSPYYSLSLSIPISKSFGVNDFINWSGKRFPEDTNIPVSIQLDGYPLQGIGSVYFVKIEPLANDTTGAYSFSGLFNGTVGSNLNITKGRFDFYIWPKGINF